MCVREKISNLRATRLKPNSEVLSFETLEGAGKLLPDINY